jgi:hypothetical protein
VAAKRLEEFANSEWEKKLPPIVQSWRRVWEEVIPFFAYPLEIQKIIYTTNAIESLHMQLRKVLKNQGTFPALTTAPCAPIESLKSFLQKRQYTGNDTNVHSEKQTGNGRRESDEIDAKLFA